MSCLLEVTALCKTYRKQHGLFRQETIKALENISFQLHAGKTLAIVGETGSGKSTLAKVLVGIEQPDQGEIRLAGKVVTMTNYRKYNHVIRYLFQDAERALNPSQKIGDMLTDVLRFSTVLDNLQRQQKVLESLQQVGLMDEHIDFYPHMFSAGQQQRIALARALILDPKLLILDEALTVLDPTLRAQIVNLLLELQQQKGLAYLLISKNLRLVRHISDHCIVMQHGQVVESGPTEQLLTQPQHAHTRKLMGMS
ncbi:ATP-binding cassette domain-containing protein [Alkalimonas collagenimarina]|uniref:ATP-binding cassette domain-containing protein n=1 Tax=Alkalimonas collagenimarina TaxID=400390 RepID=A0ABT9GVC9_9GAMM|nr:ATP-binding cassette domain-containing protein [Alkalimonas collagenimarina]MDP4535004.1 ATP-binding cassette domain-containing protein [Alkalimonas collagenimarina]